MKMSEFSSKNFQFFLTVKFSVYLYRHVFVLEYNSCRNIIDINETTLSRSTFFSRHWNIMKTRLFKYTENLIFKNWIFLEKKNKKTKKQKKQTNKKTLWYFSYFCSKHSSRGGSIACSQSMFLSRNKQNNVYPYKPQFYYIKVGFKGVKTI